jgi:hypothetical protein
MKSVDITDDADTDAELRAIVRNMGARIFRCELGTWMVRHPETLTTQFFLDQEDALGQLRDGKPPKAIKRKPTPGQEKNSTGEFPLFDEKRRDPD